MRFVIFGLVLAGILTCAFASLQSGQSDILEIFAWLGLILVTCAVALWPFAGRDQRAELELERPSWADRVHVEPRATSRAPIVSRNLRDE